MLKSYYTLGCELTRKPATKRPRRLNYLVPNRSNRLAMTCFSPGLPNLFSEPLYNEPLKTPDVFIFDIW